MSDFNKLGKDIKKSNQMSIKKSPEDDFFNL